MTSAKASLVGELSSEVRLNNEKFWLEYYSKEEEFLWNLYDKRIAGLTSFAGVLSAGILLLLRNTVPNGESTALTVTFIAGSMIFVLLGEWVISIPSSCNKLYLRARRAKFYRAAIENKLMEDCSIELFRDGEEAGKGNDLKIVWPNKRKDLGPEPGPLSDEFCEFNFLNQQLDCAGNPKFGGFAFRLKTIYWRIGSAIVIVGIVSCLYGFCELLMSHPIRTDKAEKQELKADESPYSTASTYCPTKAPLLTIADSKAASTGDEDAEKSGEQSS